MKKIEQDLLKKRPIEFIQLEVVFLIALILFTAGSLKANTDTFQDTHAGEYRNTHDDITTVGTKEPIPTLDQADQNRKNHLEQKTEPTPTVTPNYIDKDENKK